MSTPKIHPLLDGARQALARRYEKEKRLLGLAGSALSFLALVVFYFSGLSADLARLWPRAGVVWPFLAYTACLMAWMTVAGLPLSYYSGFVHEHKWDFSTQNIRGWISDQVRSFAVGLVLAWLVLAILLVVMERFPRGWWLIAGLAMAVVSVVMATLFPVVILPIFYRYTPIENKELTDALREILAREGLRTSGFFQEDMSRRTRKENAFLAGLGRTRRVVLGDNLLKHMSIPEIVSVIGHEVGHYKHRHILKGVVVETLEQLAVFYFLSVVMRLVFPGFPRSAREVLAVLPVMLIVGGAGSAFAFGPLSNALVRHFEKQADLYSVSLVENKRAFMTALAGLANRNLGNAYPSRWVKILYYTHPPVGERLAYLERASGPPPPPSEP